MNQNQQWFEDLINSPEVYILEGFQRYYRNYISFKSICNSCRLTTSSYTRKTVANDKLMQYTFEVEKSKTLRTQSSLMSVQLIVYPQTYDGQFNSYSSTSTEA